MSNQKISQTTGSKQLLPSMDFSPAGIRSTREQHAITVCAHLFLNKGIENVKMTDIADASGIGVATLYRYFGTKPGIAACAAAYLWKDVRCIISESLESESYSAMNGRDQISTLLQLFLTLYKEHGEFVNFLGEFDNFLKHETFSKESLDEYEESLVDFFPICEAAYRRGIADGSLRKIPDFYLYYCTFTHALMALCQKFIRGPLLPSDDFSKADSELELIIEAALNYLSA